MSVKQAELVRRWGLSRSRVSQYVKQGMPLDSVEAAEGWRAANVGGYDGTSKTTPADAVGGAFAVAKVGEQDLLADDLRGVAARIKQAEMDCYDLLKQERDRTETEFRANEYRARLRDYREAAKIRIEAERVLQEAQIRSGQLVSLGEAKDLIRRHDQAKRVAVEAMPGEMAERVNPADPEHAIAELKSWAGRFIERMADAV